MGAADSARLDLITVRRAMGEPAVQGALRSDHRNRRVTDRKHGASLLNAALEPRIAALILHNALSTRPAPGRGHETEGLEPRQRSVWQQHMREFACNAGG